MEDESDFFDRREWKQDGQYIFNLQRNFAYEIQEYIALKRQLLRKKNMLASGEEVEEDANKDPYHGKDPKTIELCKKQKVIAKGPLIDEDIDVKICDLGNGCWTHNHFVPKIQTR
mmetsp:Transcript_1799/g.2374  ORF Transcript_1799/g.2374 Transcript_1799/m.2374 type:complete len:115 (-) Transcript_1799:1130-1474(-)